MKDDSRKFELIVTSWATINSANAEVAEKFYNDLFKENPDVKSLFKGDISTQVKKLTYTLGFIVINLDRIDEIEKSVEELGRIHAKTFKVLPEYYPLVKKHLINSIRHFMKDDWTEEYYAAWDGLLTQVANTMINGASNEEPYPGYELKFE